MEDMDLTVAEIELLRLFDTSSRRRLMADLIGAIADLEDSLFEIAQSALEKLILMRDAAFALLPIYNGTTELEV